MNVNNKAGVLTAEVSGRKRRQLKCPTKFEKEKPKTL